MTSDCNCSAPPSSSPLPRRAFIKRRPRDLPGRHLLPIDVGFYLPSPQLKVNTASARHQTQASRGEVNPTALPSRGPPPPPPPPPPPGPPGELHPLDDICYAMAAQRGMDIGTSFVERVRWLTASVTPCVVVHYHEIALKGKNRPMFVRRLGENLRAATQGLGVKEIRRLTGRLVLIAIPGGGGRGHPTGGASPW